MAMDRMERTSSRWRHTGKRRSPTRCFSPRTLPCASLWAVAINGGLTASAPRALASGAAGAAPAIDAFIDRKLRQHALTEAQLAIVGFSQGTMMALHVGLRRRQQVAGIVGYSGMLTGAHELGHAEITKPPVLLVHGSADAIVPVAATHTAKSDLERLGIDVTVHVSPGLGHSVDPFGLKLGGEFLNKSLLGYR